MAFCLAVNGSFNICKDKKEVTFQKRILFEEYTICFRSQLVLQKAELIHLVFFISLHRAPHRKRTKMK